MQVSIKSKLFLKNISVFTFFCLIHHLFVIGQSAPLILWSEAEDKSNYNFEFNFIGEKNNTLFTYRYNPNRESGLILEKYNAIDLKKLFIQNIDFEELSESNGDQNFRKIIMFNNLFYIFSSEINKKEKKNFVYVNTVDEAGKIVVKNQVVCSSILQEGKKADEIFIETSADSSSFLITMITPQEKDKNTMLNCFILGKDLAPILIKQLEIPYLSANTNLLKTMVWNNQNIYFLVSMEDRINKKQVSSRIPFPKTYLLLCYNNKLNKFTETQIAIQSKWIHSAALTNRNNFEAAIGGFFANTADLAISGGYILNLNLQTGQIISNNIYGIARDTLNEISKSDYAAVNKKLTYFQLDHFIPFQNDHYILVGESRHVSSSSNINPYNGVDNVTYTYYYGSVICISFGPEENKLRYLYKDQRTVNDYGEYSSYGLNSYETRLGIIYNNIDVNQARSIVEPYQNTPIINNFKTDLVLSNLSFEDNTSEKTTTISWDKNKWRIVPSKSFFPDEKAIYFYAEKNGKFQLGKTEIPRK
jgi:hypothetical protein